MSIRKEDYEEPQCLLRMDKGKPGPLRTVPVARIMQKLGMRQEGYMKLDAQRLDGTYSDMVLYGILRDEWLN